MGPPPCILRALMVATSTAQSGTRPVCVCVSVSMYMCKCVCVCACACV